MKAILLICIFSFCTFMTFGQGLSSSEIKSLKSATTQIEFDSAFSNGKWKPVLKAMKKSRIVMLGEFNHGNEEVFLSRNDLIKSLHEKLGFNVILFESGIGELAVVDFKKQELDRDQMTYGFFSGWRTEAFRSLMDYVKKEDMEVAGFDIQRTGGDFQKFLKNFCEHNDVDTTLYIEIEKQFGRAKSELSNRQAVYEEVQGSVNALIEKYSFLAKNLEEIGASGKEKILIIKTLENRAGYLSYMLEFVENKDWNARWKARDLAMAENIDWLVKNFYSKDKIIVVAHNFHISKYNEKEEVMGEFLKKQFGRSFYTLCVLARTGAFRNNAGKVEEMSVSDGTKLDIKQIIGEMEGEVNFLNFSPKVEEENQWLNHKIIVNDTFIDLSNSNEMELSKNFDGILFFDKVSPSVK